MVGFFTKVSTHEKCGLNPAPTEQHSSDFSQQTVKLLAIDQKSRVTFIIDPFHSMFTVKRLIFFFSHESHHNPPER
jgi:hypothetical protein